MTIVFREGKAAVMAASKRGAVPVERGGGMEAVCGGGEIKGTDFAGSGGGNGGAEIILGATAIGDGTGAGTTFGPGAGAGVIIFGAAAGPGAWIWPSPISPTI